MSTQNPTSDDAKIYPCAECGVMRSKAEGGTTFTVCDACWDKLHPATPPDATATPRTDFPAYLADTPKALQKFESMRTRRISDMTELWQYVAEQERELTAAKAEIERERTEGESLASQVSAMSKDNDQLRARVAELEANGASEAFVTMSVRASTAEQKVAKLEADKARLLNALIIVVECDNRGELHRDPLDTDGAFIVARAAIDNARKERA